MGEEELCVCLRDLSLRIDKFRLLLRHFCLSHNQLLAIFYRHDCNLLLEGLAAELVLGRIGVDDVLIDTA